MIGDYDEIWSDLEERQSRPHFFRDTIPVDFEEFRTMVYSGKANDIIESIYQGYVYILKNKLAE